VLRLTGDAHGYARCLARIAEQTYIRRTLALAQAAVGHLKLTSQRVKRLLGPAAMHSAGWKAATAISATALVAVGAATINTPQIVGLKTPSVVSAAKAGGLMPQVGPLHIAETASPAHVIPAAVPLREPATRQVIRHSGPKLADAKTKLSTGRPQIVHTALRERTRDNAPSIVVIETSEQIYTGNEMVQIQSWRVVLISNTPSAATPVNFKAVI
jgi:hypothetical protein